MPTAPSNPTGRIRVVVVDGDDLVRETVAALLGIGDRVDVVGIAGQAEPAVELIRSVRPDVVIVDPRLPELADGLAFIETIHAIAPAVRVLIVCSPDQLAREELAVASDRCLRKTFRPDDLTAAIVAANQTTPA
jgi:DNA-binding NarL/FixJ family response regulator